MEHKFERYCKDYESIENYEAAKKDNFKNWVCHHRKGEFIPAEELRALGLYYNRPAEELLFITVSEHSSLHNTGNQYKKGHQVSSETRKKISEANKGNKYCLGRRLSEETRNKISEAHKNISEETKHKMSEAWDYDKHFTEETRKKIAAAQTGRHWYNNGEISKFCYECPLGYSPGRLKRK